MRNLMDKPCINEFLTVGVAQKRGLQESDFNQSAHGRNA